MEQSTFTTNEEKLEKAQICLELVLQILDDTDAPADIGAHLDLALFRLNGHLSHSSAQEPNSKIARRRV